jgi:hypothetical protein
MQQELKQARPPDGSRIEIQQVALGCTPNRGVHLRRAEPKLHGNGLKRRLRSWRVQRKAKNDQQILGLEHANSIF